jgi:hypothetical protein
LWGLFWGWGCWFGVCFGVVVGLFCGCFGDCQVTARGLGPKRCKAGALNHFATFFREKEKNEVRDSKVLKILETKDLHIQQLKRVRNINSK